MKKTAILFIFCSLPYFAQNLQKVAEDIKNEGVQIYRSEMASWNGTDLFLTNFKEKENIGGYFSYLENDIPRCIFFSKDNKVIGTIIFPTNYKPENAKLDLTVREFSDVEKEYAAIRQKALTHINNDTIFKRYNNTNLNLVPIINPKEKKVFVLTGPSVNGVMVLGNDYVITFNKKNEIKKVEKLHKGIIVHSNAEIPKESIPEGGSHTHVLEDWPYITSTDVCTLMLYSNSFGIKIYSVISEKYTSIWNAEGNKLVIITNDAMKRIQEDQKKRHP
ncbi:hypothetical protein [Chryseobacterium sp.]|uniref:hypothetical protein n=1 Tax=Chryseobacterium sp. TaxID=1871047 RepID=UPI0011C83270|nr:hypothetical protein [Chryseobacterium sp.]TXF77429.1 hypothetical protein FUA25_05730 [Chryseobacterium sp.]